MTTCSQIITSLIRVRTELIQPVRDGLKDSKDEYDKVARGELQDAMDYIDYAIQDIERAYMYLDWKKGEEAK